MDIDKNNKKPVQTNIAGHKVQIGTYFLVTFISFAVYIILRLRIIPLNISYSKLALNLSLAASLSGIVLVISGILELFIARRSKTKSLKYNLIQFIRLLSVLIIVLIFVSFLFHNWYTAVVSLGLISLILGFALQTPISSFIGWIYVIIRTPYHIGDRIQVDSFAGDVVEINYFDTTLWEFGGSYLTNDVPSGRLIRFPNSLILQSAVYNYSWSKFPYIWNEIPFHIAYESDLEFVQATLREVTKKTLGEEMLAHIQELKELVKETPVDELQIKDFPFVSFRTNANTWIEATVTYLVEPKKATDTRTTILKNVLAILKEQPDKAMFPKSNSR
jgi:small-conductance mechanosensitive channel